MTKVVTTHFDDMLNTFNKKKNAAFEFCEAEYFEIPNLLEDESFRTFKQAVDEDLPLGGFLDTSYEEWYTAALSGE